MVLNCYILLILTFLFAVFLNPVKLCHNNEVTF